jgi:hypothetical protein
MTSQFKYARILNGIVLTYFTTLLLLELVGHITFGHGLGDLYYLIFVASAVAAHSITTLILHRQRLSEHWFMVTAVVFLLLVIFVTYKFTLGRGPEYKWDGNVFI